MNELVDRIVRREQTSLDGVQPGQHIVLDLSLFFLERPAPHLPFLQGHRALAELCASNLESRSRAEIQGHRELDPIRTGIHAAQDLAGGVQNPAAVGGGREQHHRTRSGGRFQ
jgi:hypothetical protein